MNYILAKKGKKMKSYSKTFFIFITTSLLFVANGFASEPLILFEDTSVIKTLEKEIVVPKWNDIPPEKKEVIPTPYITFNVAYLDNQGQGFNDTTRPGRKDCLRKVLEYVSTVLAIPQRTLDITVAESINNPSISTLAQGGSRLFKMPNDNFWYYVSQYRLTVDSNKVTEYAEIFLFVNFGNEYYEDPNNWNINNNQYDLFSVLLHEITHGLGFICSVSEDGSSCDNRNCNIYTSFERCLYKSGQPLFGGSPLSFLGTPNDLISNAVFFFSPIVAERFPAPGLAIYSKNPFDNTMSLSHWDPERTNIPDAVMNPRLRVGQLRRVYHLIDLCALKSIGYNNINLPNPNTPDGEGSGTNEGSGSTTKEGEGQSNPSLEGQNNIPEGEGSNTPIQEGQNTNINQNNNDNTICCGGKSYSLVKSLLDIIFIGALLLLLVSLKKNSYHR